MENKSQMSGEPTRIGLDATNLGVGTGVGNYISALLKSVRALKPNVKFVLYSNRVIEFDEGVQLRTSAPFRRGVVWQETQLPQMVNEDQIDVFWGANGLLPTFRKLRCPTVITVHDLVHRFAPETQQKLVLWSRRVFQPRSCRVATRVTAVSHATARDIEQCYGAQVHAVIHPQTGSQFSRIERGSIERVVAKYSLPRSFLLTVGTLEPRKNIVNLIHAYVDCLDQQLSLPKLVLAGGVGWLNANIERIVATAEQANKIRRLGFVDPADLPALYAASSAFVMPSIYEGYGMPIAEAQFCGAPVIHGNHPSMVEAAGGLGYTIEPTRAGIREMLTDYAAHALPLKCRLVSEAERSPVPAAQTLWNVICDAFSGSIKEHPPSQEPLLASPPPPANSEGKLFNHVNRLSE
jgi:glycosyltransferase involved in cell wall biosynthesis